MKDPIVKKSDNPISGTQQVMLIFESDDHLKEWIADNVQPAIRKARADALSDMQKRARELFQDIFGREL